MADRFLGVSAVVVFIWFFCLCIGVFMFLLPYSGDYFPFLLMLDCIATWVIIVATKIM